MKKLFSLVSADGAIAAATFFPGSAFSRSPENVEERFIFATVPLWRHKSDSIEA